VRLSPGCSTSVASGEWACPTLGPHYVAGCYVAFTSCSSRPHHLPETLARLATPAVCTCIRQSVLKCGWGAARTITYYPTPAPLPACCPSLRSNGFALWLGMKVRRQGMAGCGSLLRAHSHTSASSSTCAGPVKLPPPTASAPPQPASGSQLLCAFHLPPPWVVHTQPSEIFFFLFLPPLLLDSAVRIDFYVFRKVRPSASLVTVLRICSLRCQRVVLPTSNPLSPVVFPPCISCPPPHHPWVP